MRRPSDKRRTKRCVCARGPAGLASPDSDARCIPDHHRMDSCARRCRLGRWRHLLLGSPSTCRTLGRPARDRLPLRSSRIRPARRPINVDPCDYRRSPHVLSPVPIDRDAAVRGRTWRQDWPVGLDVFPDIEPARPPINLWRDRKVADRRERPWSYQHDRRSRNCCLSTV